MEHLLLAIKGDSVSFPRIAEDLIRREFPTSIEFKLKIPVQGPGTREVTVTLRTIPFVVSVKIENDGYIHAHLEVEVYLVDLAHDLQVNDVFLAGERIPTTNVLMPKVPPMPLKHSLEREPHLIGVPSIKVHVARTTQTVLDENRLRLNAVIEPGQITITPNFAGLLQVLIRKIADDITDAIKGEYGETYLSKILALVVNFISLFLRHVLQVFKIPEAIFAELFSRLAREIQSELTKYWSPREVSVATIPRRLTIAPAVNLTDGREKHAVEVSISKLSARANVVTNPSAKEFVASVGLEDV